MRTLWAWGCGGVIEETIWTLKIDPFTLIATANVAFKAIKQGCELFREGQALVKDVVKTANEVKAIGKEVTGIFGFFKNLFTPAKKERTIKDLRPAKQVKNKTEEFDPTELYSEIGKNLTAFFKAYNALKNHVEEEEMLSKTVYDPTGDQAEKAINRVLAMTRMEEMSVELREYMVYHVPPELKDLYTRVNKMLGTIENEQALARQAMFRKRREIEAERRLLQDKIWFRTASLIAVAFVATYFVGLMWAINRMSHGSM